MERSQSKYNGQLEINDLIGDAVKNAVFRRHQVVDSEDVFSALSDEEAGSIAGGMTKPIEAIIAGSGAVTAGGIPIRRPFPLEDSAVA